MTFEELKLHSYLLMALEREGYTTPTPIQEQAIPPALEGRDILGGAQTGTGKTAAFTLPLLHILAQDPPAFQPNRFRALVLSPTRELADQIAERVRAYSRFLPLTETVVYGGVSQVPQVARLKEGLDVLVATPGRLMDLHNQRHVDFSDVEFLVLDEADRMLDMGFIEDIREIISYLPKDRRTMMFSATLPAPIQRLAKIMLKDPVKVSITPDVTTAEGITQEVLYVRQRDKTQALLELLDLHKTELVLIFTETKIQADSLYNQLTSKGLEVEVIHGDKQQNRRQLALEKFKDGRAPVLIATDVAARGIDVDGISHVINYEIPNNTESYVHRIGRTARAGATGTAISLCDVTELAQLREIERFIEREIPFAKELAEDVSVSVWSDGTRAGAKTANRSRRGKVYRLRGRLSA